MPLRHAVILKPLNTKVSFPLDALAHADVSLDSMDSIGWGNDSIA